jgi:hypothetical protein
MGDVSQGKNTTYVRKSGSTTKRFYLKNNILYTSLQKDAMEMFPLL